MEKIYKDIKVLFVEDNKQIEEELIPILNKYFESIDFAKSGDEGIKKEEQNSYDLIITDIVMPNLDRLKMIENIKAKKPKIKFIIVTSHTNPDFLIKLIELGINGYLIKPITFKQISNTLKKIVNEINIEKNLKNKMQEIEKLAQVKSEFLANMSHEIRTPLNAILGFIKLSKEETNLSKIKKYLDIMDSSSKTLLTIINDILEISKIEAGKIKIELIDFQTKDLFTSIELFKSQAKEKNIDFQIHFKNLPKYLKGDIHRIKQILSNLISNSIKFTKDKTIFVNIKYKKNRLFVEVKDEGIGIPKDKIDSIFEEFNQADNSTTRKYGGTGLGLSISYQLVKLMGGELKVSSEENKGSRFYFDIPIKVGKKTSYTKTQYHKIRPDLKILIAEDNIANQMFMKVVFNKLNISFDIANDGIETINMLKNSHYDLILMDINMPIMSGIEATKKIRKFSDIPIIALTASALEGDKERFLEAGMNDYLSKPLDINKLKNILSTFQ